MMAPLDAIFQPELHVVAQVVEAEFVVGAVSNIGGVGFFAFLVVQVVHNHAHAQPQEAVQAAHPFGVALGQIVVDRNHVHTSASEGVQIARQGSDQGITFTGLHFGDAPGMEHHAANQLHVEMAHVENAPAGFPHDGESFNQKVVDRSALGQFFP